MEGDDGEGMDESIIEEVGRRPYRDTNSGAMRSRWFEKSSNNPPAR